MVTTKPVLAMILEACRWTYIELGLAWDDGLTATARAAAGAQGEVGEDDAQEEPRSLWTKGPLSKM